jgi:predicted DNA-binding transcriptional regulator AlpA
MTNAQLAGIHEAAEVLAVSTQRVHELAKRDDFPTPLAVLAGGRVWRRSEIERWSKRYPRRPGRPRKAA